MNVILSIVIVIFGLGIAFFTVKIIRHFARSFSDAQKLASRIAHRELSALEHVKKSHPGLPKNEQYVVAFMSSRQETANYQHLRSLTCEIQYYMSLIQYRTFDILNVIIAVEVSR